MKRPTLILLAVLLFAAALRFYRMDAQSLWSDEGSSVAQALRDVPAIVDNAARDIHPPLYYLVLHFWVLPFGTSEIGVRSLSALLGLVLVGLCYWLGQEWYDERVGLLAAGLSAINPFQIYYAQEARMYMLMAALGALCFYATLRSATAGRKRRTLWLGVYGVAAVAGLYTHYLFPIVIAVCNIMALSGLLPRRSEAGRSATALAHAPVSWLIVQAVIVLAFAPWLPTALQQISTWPSGAQTFSAGDAPAVLWRTLSLGLSAPRDDALWLTLFLVLALLGATMRRDSELAHLPASPARRLLVSPSFPVLVYLLSPVAVMFALALFKDAFLKFMLVASPPFVLLVANGIANAATTLANPRVTSRIAYCVLRIAHQAAHITFYVSRFTFHASAILLLLALSIPSYLSLQGYYFDPRFARDDYRSIAATIEALARPEDAIILNAPGQQEIFQYYYRGNLPIYPLPRQRPLERGLAEAELNKIVGKHRRLFVVLWATDESDPQHVIEGWLDAHTFKAGDSWYSNVRLALFAAVQPSEAVAHPLDLRWGDRITLLGYTQDAQTIPSGDILPLTLFWRAERPITQRYKVFVHLLDPRGFVIAQRDSEPVGGSRPTSGWQTGETIRDAYGLFIPPGTPPLGYQIEIGLYDASSGERLRNTLGGDRLLLMPLKVEATVSPRAIPGLSPLGLTLSGLTLIGYRLEKVGAEGQRGAELRAGDAVHLTLFWRKPAAEAGDGVYRLGLGALVRETTPTDGLYPVAQWSSGEIVRDDQLIALPADWRAGRYDLTINAQKIAEVEVR